MVRTESGGHGADIHLPWCAGLHAGVTTRARPLVRDGLLQRRASPLSIVGLGWICAVACPCDMAGLSRWPPSTESHYRRPSLVQLNFRFRVARQAEATRV